MSIIMAIIIMNKKNVVGAKKENVVGKENHNNSNSNNSNNNSNNKRGKRRKTLVLESQGLVGLIVVLVVVAGVPRFAVKPQMVAIPPWRKMLMLSKMLLSSLSPKTK